jgi:hypothetical protein
LSYAAFLQWAPLMHEYEIRILHADGTADTVEQVMHLNDNAAIRAGRKIAEARPFEVWRDQDCIYGRASGVGL